MADFLPDPALTFPSVFESRVGAHPDRAAFYAVTFDRQTPVAVAHTFSEIRDRARRAIDRMASSGVRQGDRVILCAENPAKFLCFFLAAQALDAIPVPLPSASESRAGSAFVDRIAAVGADCAPRVIVVESKAEADAVANLAFDAPILVAEDAPAPLLVPSGTGDSTFVANRSGDSTLVANRSGDPPLLAGGRQTPRFENVPSWPAYIQYTSGSTGSPKGVVVTHENLRANMRASTEAAGFTAADRSLSWLPLYHDMGLVGGLLLGIYLGIDTFVMPTRSFVGRPDSWLRAISHFRATFSCAPNFAYNILARRLPDSALRGLDLTQWRLAFNGAEPIDHATVDDFMARFAPCGLRRNAMFPVYGLAECTLAVSFPAPQTMTHIDTVDRDALSSERLARPAPAGSACAVRFVSVGRAIPGHRVRILELNGDSEVPARHVGEVAVRGPSVTPFYFRRQGPHPSVRDEIRTGDLGYLADGELYLVDRIKDLLIVGGRNVVPSDVERIVAQLPGVRYGAVVAFTIRGSSGTDELYLVVGVESQSSTRGGDAPATRGPTSEQIRRIVYDHFGLNPKHVVFVKPSAIPKTSSGKIRRTACRDLYESGAFSADNS